MESAFGVDHGDISKSVKTQAAHYARKVTGVREKGKATVNMQGKTQEFVDRSGSWALKPRRDKTTWSSSGVKTETTGGGLTGRGKVAVGGLAAGGAGGAEGYRRKRNQNF